ncbi:hypothetical protein [Geothrix limicola]|uniref:hypothetical protein n=1 Tax=Geothrix limicola TaxID=2927978 RepID=UPI002555BAF5|nr:hypothetical protein [Geothrix limicola]
MIRFFIISLVASTGLFSQIIPLKYQLLHLPFFRYPALAKVAKIHGQLNMTLTVESGKVTSIRPSDGEDKFRIPQLAQSAVEDAKLIEFHSSFSGEVVLHIVFRTSDKEGSKSRMEFDPEAGTITIESERGYFCALPAITK